MTDLFALYHLHAQFLRQLYAELRRRNSPTPGAEDGAEDGAGLPDPHNGFDPATLDQNAIHDLITQLEDARDSWRDEIEAATEEVEQLARVRRLMSPIPPEMDRKKIISGATD